MQAIKDKQEMEFRAKAAEEKIGNQSASTMKKESCGIKIDSPEPQTIDEPEINHQESIDELIQKQMSEYRTIL